MTYNVELYIGFNSNGDAVSTMALLHYFLQAGEKGEMGRNLYLVCGHIAGIMPLSQVSKGVGILSMADKPNSGWTRIGENRPVYK